MEGSPAMPAAQNGILVCGNLSIEIDANSRAPLHVRSSIPHDTSDGVAFDDGGEGYSDEYTLDDGGEGYSDKYSDSSSSDSIYSEAGSDAPILPTLSRAAQEKKVWAEFRRSRLGSEMKDKIQHLILRQSDEAREAKLLLRRCRNSSLAHKVQNADKQKRRNTHETTTSSSGFSTPSFSPRRLSVSTTTAADSPKRSPFPSLFSAQSIESSASTLSKDDGGTPLRQRKISQPLEYDPTFHPRQLTQDLEAERRNSVSPSKTSEWRKMCWTPPSRETCTSCEIKRTVTRQTLDNDCIDPLLEEPENENEEQPVTKVWQKLSDEEGNDFIEEVRDTDEKGRKKVLLQWGAEVDEIIPEGTRKDEEAGTEGAPSSTRRRVKCWLSSLVG